MYSCCVCVCVGGGGGPLCLWEGGRVHKHSWQFIECVVYFMTTPFEVLFLIVPSQLESHK